MRRAALVPRRHVIGLVLCALAVGAPAAPAVAQHRTTLSRRERVLASLPFDSREAGALVISPDGTRGAYVKRVNGLKGRLQVVIDGNVGQADYEQVGRNLVTFSPDSRRVAFAAAREGKWHVVLDGVEGEPFDAVAGDSITFSPDGARLAYVADRGDTSLVVLDGAAGKAYDAVIDGSLTFSADGARLAYVALTGGKEVLVLDGAEGIAYERFGPPRFSRDGKHVACVATATGSSAVVLDGNEGRALRGDDQVHPASLAFSPDGERLAYVVGPPGRMRAVIDGAEGKAYEQVYDGSIAFSPEGRRVAYMAKRAGARRGPSAVVVIDGNDDKPHDGVVPGTLRFSADGRRVAYLAENVGADGTVRRCAVVDGVAGTAYDWVRDAPVFSPDGRHFAYVAERRKPGAPGTPGDVTGFESLVVVDGTDAGPYPWVRGDLVFTPDGLRLAYMAAAPDDRFQDAGEIPADPANPSFGGRLVFDKTAQTFGVAPDVPTRPVRLLVVEEQIRVE
jgi:Tol biopolymer transport system component